MARAIKQFRYYGADQDQVNEPNNLTLEQLVSGRAFENYCLKTVKK